MLGNSQFDGNILAQKARCNDLDDNIKHIQINKQDNCEECNKHKSLSLKERRLIYVFKVLVYTAIL